LAEDDAVRKVDVKTNFPEPKLSFLTYVNQARSESYRPEIALGHAWHISLIGGASRLAQQEREARILGRLVASLLSFDNGSHRLLT
jgi:hypothetical protein